MDDYNLFKTYVAMKSHFTTEAYDYIKYGGKVSISETAYQKRKDIASFKIVAGWLPQKHCESLLVSHFIEMNDFTISFLCENPTKSQKIYNRWKERTSNILEVYNKDIKTIAHASSGSWRDCIIQSEDDYPLLFKLVMSRKIAPETYSLLDDLFQHTSKAYKGMDTDLMFLGLNLKYRKYRSFLTPSIKDILSITPKDLTSV
jgi:hypothetical protein